MSYAKKRSTTTSPGGDRSRINLYLTLGVIAVALLALGGLMWMNRGDDADTNAAPAAPAGHVLSTAPAGQPELVEYLDFQCEACNAYYHTITKDLVADYDGRISFTVRMFPLPGHPLGMPAARAAEAAALQGSFADYYTVLFDEYETWATHGGGVTSDAVAARAYFLGVAQRLNLDIDRFTTDMDSARVLTTVQDSVRDGEALGVSGTPTFFLNGEKFDSSAQSFAEYDRQLRAALDAGIE